MTRAARIINFRHPGYDALVANFARADPLKAAKRAIDRRRLLQLCHRPVLLVSLESPGGIKRHVEQRMAALTASGNTALLLHAVLSSGGKSRAVLTAPGADLGYLSFAMPRELDELRLLLTELRLHAVELHHFLGLPAPALEMLAALGVPYRVFIHDYAWICPRINLLNGAGTYCGEPTVDVCESCIRQHGSALPEPVTVAELRARSARIIGKATDILVPTEDVRARLARYFPGAPMRVQPWEIRVRTPPRPRPNRREGRVRVAVVGAINAVKGWAVLLECARDAAQRGLPLDFIVVGYTRDDLPLLRTGRVFVTGPYREAEAAALLEREACDIALFPTMGPETWCYTLTHALDANLPILAFDLGAVAERLRGAGVGELIPVSTAPADVNDALLRMVAAGAASARIAYNAIEVTSPMEHSRKTEDVVPPVRSDDAEAAAAPDLGATVQVLTLPTGLYAFTVQSGGGDPSMDLRLPAFQVAPAPVRSAGAIEFFCGPSTLDRWLTGPGDVVTVRISGGDATLLLTSLRAPDSGLLSIDVQRLDVVAAPAAAPRAPSLPETPRPAIANTRLNMLVHVPYLGDLRFAEGWAGRPSENLWIEGFSVTVEEPAAPDLLEYCAVDENGDVTDWLTGGEFCGNRGTGVPLVAFAVRVRTNAVPAYSCLYAGRFLSGTVIGPFDDGSLCRSEATGDPLVAIELQIEPIAARIPSLAP